ncbi:MAG TPA: histidine phosphatase family protein [Candidatus Eubacterium faecavium]|nr:histidine phosphatase family protein [Candidatus Eubacterium faecavium]
MKILFARHAEPDYEHDTITEKGKREAALLAERMAKIQIDEIYVSPLGRAQDTAAYTLFKIGKSAQTLDWLHEFKGKVLTPKGIKSCWDRLPEHWTVKDEYYDVDRWYKTPLMRTLNVKREYEYVCAETDRFLAQHGYVRDGRFYRAEKPNRKTVVFFCHFAVECAILSRIFSISPMILWHNFAALPSSVTTIVTEERRKGKAQFRCLGFGDIAHLYAGDEEPSFAVRFCECFDDETRHD